MLAENQRQFDATLGKLASLAGVSRETKTIADHSLNKLAEKEGVLSPGTAPDPTNPCAQYANIPPDATILYYGGSAAVTRGFPLSVITFNGHSLVSLYKAGNSLEISADLFDERGELVAKIEKNHFIATYAASHIEKSNDTLTVYGRHDNMVLKVEFLNKHSIRVSGEIRTDEGEFLIAIGSQATTDAHHNTYSGGCMNAPKGGTVFGFN